MFGKTYSYFDVKVDLGVSKDAMLDNQLASYEFYLSTNDLFFKREVYGALDFVGDIGGLFDGLGYIFLFILKILKFLGRNHLDVHIIR